MSDPIDNQPKSIAVQVVGFIVAVAICFAAAGLGASVTTPDTEWFVGLNKPTWNPPNWVFGPVWSTLYFLMAVSVWLVWRSGSLRQRIDAIACFGVQMGLNVIWSFLFFGMQQPTLAAVEIVGLWVAIVATIFLFRKYSSPAAILLLPYLAWVSFAAVLNITIAVLNR